MVNFDWFFLQVLGKAWQLMLARAPYRFGLCWLWIPALLLAVGWGSSQLWNRAQQHKLLRQPYAPPPPGMVLVPAGPFLMGSNEVEADPDEKPLRKIFLASFYMDQFEVTNLQYKQFKKSHTYPPGAEQEPVTFVLKSDAEAYARFVGKRLPTSAEWEKAARGIDGRAYPWGQEFRPGYANVSLHRLDARARAALCLDPASGTGPLARGKQPVGSFPLGVSPYGCHDMSGNVWEWVGDVWRDRDLIGRATGTARGILRGGAYAYSHRQARTSYQGFEDPDTTCHDVGFRCALDAIPIPR